MVVCRDVEADLKSNVVQRQSTITWIRRGAVPAILALIAVFSLNLPAAAQSSDGGRIALVIANGNYPDANLPLPSAYKDADLLANELGQDGFDVTSKRDLNSRDMQAEINAFEAKIGPGTAALIYFNGIGIQAGHQTYLIPVKAELWSESDVKLNGINLDNLLADFHRRGARIQIAIVDASRRNPFERRFRAYSAGLAVVNAPDKSLVMYAVAPNKVGSDGDGDVSLFMNELVKEMRAPGLNAELAMTQTRLGVANASHGEQVPWVVSTLVEPFYFGRTPTAQDSTTTPPSDKTPDTKPSSGDKPAQTDNHAADSTTAKDSTPSKDASNQPSTTKTPSTTTPGTSDAKPTETAQAPDDLKAGVKFKDCPDCPEMTVVPDGTFEMGTGRTPFDRPVHRVTIAQPFAIGTTEITFDDWGKCVSDGGCTFKPDPQGFGGGDQPVINIGWFDAKTYVAWISKKTGKSYRLPSEAEWEYAAHGGTTTPFSWGATVGKNLADCVDCGGDGKRHTVSVRTFAPNKFGLYGMAGNAAEWVEDCWNKDYRGAPHDGSAWVTGECTMRVLRGGSFDSTSAYIKPAARFRYDSDVRYWANGFRIARSVP